MRSGGGIALAGGGGWKFVPAEGAMVARPDTEYQYFGWWLRAVDDTYALGVFHAGAGGAADEFASLAALQGTATYRGPAAGMFVVDPEIGEASAGGFTASATLEVDFADAADRGSVSGTVDGFVVGGERMPWSVELAGGGHRRGWRDRGRGNEYGAHRLVDRRQGGCDPGIQSADLERPVPRRGRGPGARCAATGTRSRPSTATSAT